MEETWDDIRKSTRPLGSPPSRRGGLDKAFSSTDAAPRFLSLRRLQRGDYEPQATIDLHGLTLIQAHDRLMHVVRRAMDQKQRLLLVITGKGNNSQPHARTMKQAFEEWMRSPPFCPLVAYVCPAAKRHGDTGAYYILLKKH